MADFLYTEAHKAFVRVFVATRKKSGLRQEDLAKIIGKDQSYISYIEQGQRKVDIVSFYRISKALSVDPVSFFNDIVLEIESTKS